MVAGAGGSRSRGIHGQEAEGCWCWHSACFFLLRSRTAATAWCCPCSARVTLFQLTSLETPPQTPRGLCDDSRPRQVNHHSLPVCALPRRRLRPREADQSRTLAARPTGVRTSGPQMMGSGVPKTLPRVQETETSFITPPRDFFRVHFVSSE